MAARPIWRGHLRLALVSCPIALYAVHRARAELHFHFINPKTGNRVRSVVLDADTDEQVSRSELVRGYEFEKDRYVTLDPEDFESAKVESSNTLTIDKFVDAAAIPALYVDTSYYLAPEGDAGSDVYVVLREAIAKAGKAALSRIVISRRERAVAILPHEPGMVLHTLHESRAIADPTELFSPIAKLKADHEMVNLAMQLVDRQVAPFEPTDIEDRYEARLRKVIAAKLQGEGVAPVERAVPPRDNVIDLMAALKRSLGQKEPSAPRAAAAARRAPRKRAPKKQASRKHA
jgi:DNA end-binding protein Ku